MEKIQRERAMKDGGAINKFYKDNMGRDPWHSWD
jgi:hypothetical protein